MFKRISMITIIVVLTMSTFVGVANAAPELPEAGDMILCNANNHMLGPNAAFDSWTRLTEEQASRLAAAWSNNHSYKAVEEEICSEATDVGDNPDAPDHPHQGEGSNSGVIPGLIITPDGTFNRAGNMPAAFNAIDGIPAAMTVTEDGVVLNPALKAPEGLNKPAATAEVVTTTISVATVGSSNHVPAGQLVKVEKVKKVK